ncbi:transcriptional regulator TyrR [Vibrio sp. JC009]|uniref:transcriptional regulator TyrR n=1 Tax=Vibrio sp. JC009 TaxID=2912314 RepID=UPI0023AF40AB|nr:transcriptional regulator TyrR [Vibrio sp. JC009]WED20557.1 transcriptional regulator TyrR [Vibrio sp. JC009]
MRLEVLCEDRLGLTRELLDILASMNIDLRGIEIDVVGIIYLNCPETDFETFSELMTQIRKISGVTDVRKIQFMPAERHNYELISILDNLPEPVLAINLKGQVDQVNHAAETLLGKDSDSLLGENISTLISTFAFSKWLDGDRVRQRETVVIEGIDYVMDIMPVYIQGESSNESIFASVLITLRAAAKQGGEIEFLADNNTLGFDHFVGISNRHKALMSHAKKLSMLEQPLLIEGETGTGKEMLARACHNRSSRADKPFLVLSCASMPDDVAETELFGNAPGALNQDEGHKGIFELADGGTVFLDEIGEMSPHLQMKILRFLQDGTFRRVGEEKEMHVDVRVIASTKQNLAQLTENNEFREDLFYRLNVLTLTIPSLRDRPSDVAALLELFLTKYSQQLGIDKPEVSEKLLEELSNYQWPGNIRELDNAVLRALTRITDSELSIEHFQLPKVESSFASAIGINLEGSLDDIMKEYEAKVLDRLFQSFPSSRKLAKRLGVSHTSIANKLRDYDIRKQ